MPSFQDFPLLPTTHAVLNAMEIIEPTPIQTEAIPPLLAGRDLVGQSATGSGKTLAYSIPLIERVARDRRTVQALVLVPTRELAVQVNTVLSKLAASRRISTALLVGGQPYNRQISSLRYGAQIVVGTPGRVKDHLERGTLLLDQLRICILDEADQMLDSGFAPVIEDILITTPATRQMALFSATMPDWVAKIQQKFLKDPVKVSIQPATGAESVIEQIAYQVPRDQKIAALCTLLRATQGESSLIFGRTKFGVERLGKQLSRLGFTVGTLHGNKSQRAREEVLSAFRHGRVHTLLATNVAARGLDIQGIHQVINFELPESSELFTHRIGRTGRMGRPGKAITLLIPSDIPKWRRMVHGLGQAVALQRLALDEEALFTLANSLADVPATPEYQPPTGPRGRRSTGPDLESRPRPQFDPEPRQRPQREQRAYAYAEQPLPAREANRQYRSTRDNQDFTPEPEPRQQRVQPKPNRPVRLADRENTPTRTPARTPAWQDEDAPRRDGPPASNSRPGHGKPSAMRKTSGQYKEYSSSAPAPRTRAFKARPGATTTRTKRPAVNRSARP